MIYSSSLKKALCGALVLASLFSLLIVSAEAGQRNHAVIRPANAKAVVLSVEGRELIYYQLDKSRTIKVTVTGPGKLIILSRLGFPPGVSGPQEYSLEIREGGNLIKSYSTSTDRSKASLRDSKVVPGKSRRSSLNAPLGRHTFSMTPKQPAMADVYLRFLYERNAGSGKRVFLTPLSYSRIASTLIRETPISYFVATPEHGVTLRVVGPTKLRVVSRLNYDAKMDGDQKYAVLVEENGKPLLTKPLLTSKSLGVDYRDWKEVVPGKGQIFSVEVPAGEHTYVFKPGESIAQSVSLRFSIPGKDVPNRK